MNKAVDLIAWVLAVVIATALMSGILCVSFCHRIETARWRAEQRVVVLERDNDLLRRAIADVAIKQTNAPRVQAPVECKKEPDTRIDWDNFNDMSISTGVHDFPVNVEIDERDAQGRPPYSPPNKFSITPKKRTR